MADDTLDQKLRDMAEHRGMKLLKSRKRKAGVGDYGKFGLVDASGKPLLGIGSAGLTALPSEVEAYLRAAEISTWQASAKATTGRPAPAATKHARDRTAEPEIAIRPRGERRSPVAPDSGTDGMPPRGKRGRTDKAIVAEPTRPNARSKTPERSRQTARPAAAPVMAPKPTPEPEHRLVVRTARAADAIALVPVFSQLAGVEIDELAIARNLEAARKAKSGMVVASLGKLVGCCGWAVIPTVQHGPVGRLTVLLVDEKHRRRGIATALVEAATASLRQAGCRQVEAMSDIDIKNAHNFFRTLKFDQTSYRFARKIVDI